MSEAQGERIAQLYKQGMSDAEIGRIVGIKTYRVGVQRRSMGLHRIKRGGGDRIATAKKDRAEKHAQRVRDRRRFKTTPVPFGEPSVMVDADFEGPMFPSRVFVPDGSERVLKDGSSNSKIGGDVLVGKLKGARIYTLTLPERTTCPKSCPLWRGCYGNSMQYARRWQPGRELEEQIVCEIKAMCAKDQPVLVRLHVLGDFYSFDYIKLWAELLDTYHNLYVFGFTAHADDTHLGAGISRLRGVYPDRFAIRHSGTTGRWGTFTLPFPTEAKTIGDAIVCPEQLDGMKGSPQSRHCGNCGVCWATDRPIAFVEH